MTARFVDTNVLIYAVSTDPADAGKAACARRVLEDSELVVSVQVLQEFYVQATRPTRRWPLSHAQARRFVEALMRFPVQELTGGLVLAALATRERYGVSYWDAAILEAARSAGCDVVLTEDLSDGMDYGGVRVEDPFRDC